MICHVSNIVVECYNRSKRRLPLARVVSLVVTTSDCDVHDRTNCFIRPARSNKAGAARKEFARSRFDVTIRLLAAIMDQKSPWKQFADQCRAF